MGLHSEYNTVAENGDFHEDVSQMVSNAARVTINHQDNIVDLL